MPEAGRPVTDISLAERVLGTADPGDVDGSLVTAHYTLTGERVTPAEFLNETEYLRGLTHTVTKGGNDRGLYLLHPDDTERSVAAGFVRSVFVNNEPNPFATVLNRWPMYADHYERFVRAGEAREGVRRALLVGSLSAVSSRAFVALAEDVYGTAPGHAYIIDPLTGKDKKRHGSFVQGNGLAMPFADGCMRIVQTNILLHMILGPGDKLAETAAAGTLTRTLLSEMHRVMQPGGHLLMQEVPPGLDMKGRECKGDYNQRLGQEFESTIRFGLEEVGFAVDAVEKTWKLRGDFLFDPSRQFDSYERVPYPRAYAICARKPAA